MSMTFDLQKFSADVRTTRGKKTQKKFAEELGLSNHSLISLYEDAKRAPSKEVFANFCRIANKNANDYWIQDNYNPPSAYLMGNLGEKDRGTVKNLIEKISAYEYLFAQLERIK